MGLFLVKKVVNKKVPISTLGSYIEPIPISEGVSSFSEKLSVNLFWYKLSEKKVFSQSEKLIFEKWRFLTIMYLYIMQLPVQ